MMMKKTIYLLFAACLFFSACEPYLEDGVDLPPLPDAPDFLVEPHPTNPNKFVVTSTEADAFNHVWEMPGGAPNVSSLAVDTVFFQKAGTYEITLHIAARDGGGTSSATKTVNVAEDAELECDENLSLLTDECTFRCWRLSDQPGSIAVGPIPLSSEWFSSSELEGSQADDLWCFQFEGGALDYQNNGVSFSTCAGYAPVENYPIPPDMTYTISPSNSDYSDIKITLSDEYWMGVEDSGPEYEIVQMNENALVLLSAIKPCDGSPSPGWFTITFVAD
jgi:hypothetical protein